MGFLLQYQAHVDDLTSLAGNPEDVSWFSTQPFGAPRESLVPDSGLSVGDSTSGAGVAADDQSWFSTQPFESPRRLQILDEGISVGDKASAAGKPEDVSWFVSYPHKVPLERQVAPQGAFAADLTTAEGVLYVLVGSIYRHNSVGGGVLFLEADFRAITGRAFVRLFDLTSSIEVSGSTLDTTGTSLAKFRGNPLTLTDGNDYRTQVGKVSSNAGAIIGSKLVVFV